MGMSSNFLVGPYLECKVEAVSHEEMFKISEEINEKLHFGCGDGIWDWCKKNNLVLWFPNVGLGSSSIRVEADEICVHQVTSQFIRDQMVAFDTGYEKEIQFMKQKYGETNVKIKWGIVNDIS